MLNVDCWLVVDGCWLFVVGCWLVVVGRPLFVLFFFRVIVVSS